MDAFYFECNNLNFLDWPYIDHKKNDLKIYYSILCFLDLWNIYHMMDV